MDKNKTIAISPENLPDYFGKKIIMEVKDFPKQTIVKLIGINGGWIEGWNLTNHSLISFLINSDFSFYEYK